MKPRQKKMDLFTVDTVGEQNLDEENGDSEILYAYNETESAERSENSEEEETSIPIEEDDDDEEKYDYGGKKDSNIFPIHMELFHKNLLFLAHRFASTIR